MTDESNCKFAERDPKTAFLEELKGLLQRHKACVWMKGASVPALVVSLNGDEYVVPEMYGINADNIDFIKNKI